MWVRLDDAIAHHPKLLRAGPEAFALFVAGLCYCNRYATNGLIPKLAVAHLLPGIGERRAMELAMRLASNDSRPSWIEAGDHYRVHDYEIYQPPRDAEREQMKRAKDAERQRRCRARQAGRGGEVEESAAGGGHGGEGVTGRDGHGSVTGDGHGPVTRDGHGAVRDSHGLVTRDGHGGVSVTGRDGHASPLPGPLPPARTRPGPEPVSLPSGRKKLSSAPAREGRDLASEFQAWFAAYPRQEAEEPARRAWLAAPELPGLAELLERLAGQTAAKPEATFWPAAERYLRERRWRDQPPATAGPRSRSADAERRALGSDESRRQRLREISAEAAFDPEAADA